MKHPIVEVTISGDFDAAEVHRALIGLRDETREAILRASGYCPGQWVDTGRTRGSTTVYAWTWRLRWGFIPWPIRYAAGGLLGKRVLRWHYPKRTFA